MFIVFGGEVEGLSTYLMIGITGELKDGFVDNCVWSSGMSKETVWLTLEPGNVVSLTSREESTILLKDEDGVDDSWVGTCALIL